MPRYAQLVMGPAGSGKSTYCSVIQKHAEICKRNGEETKPTVRQTRLLWDVYVRVHDLIEFSVQDEKGKLVFCFSAEQYFRAGWFWPGFMLG